MYSLQEASSPQNSTTNILQPCDKKLATPKTNRSINDSKSPRRLSKLKKSKRRECTPAYSPPDSETKGESHHYLTERKKNPSNSKISIGGNRLCFECPENRMSFLSINNEDQNVKNLHESGTKKHFLSLIEESLNEVNDNYYGVLGSQTTPDTIFRSLFGEEKENPEKRSQANGKEEEMMRVNEGLNKIISELSRRNFEILETMKTQIILIDKDITYFEASRSDFAQMFLGVICDSKNTCYSKDSNLIFIPGNIFLKGMKQGHSTNSFLTNTANSRFIFELDSYMRPSLSVIEIHLFAI